MQRFERENLQQQEIKSSLHQIGWPAHLGYLDQYSQTFFGRAHRL
jgi:hypothetical protein